MDIGQYRAGVRRRAATYAVRATRQLGGEARDRALAAARNLTVFFPEAKVHAVIRKAAERNPAADSLGQLYRYRRGNRSRWPRECRHSREAHGSRV
jgi:hypothetical protein